MHITLGVAVKFSNYAIPARMPTKVREAGATPNTRFWLIVRPMKSHLYTNEMSTISMFNYWDRIFIKLYIMHLQKREKNGLLSGLILNIFNMVI